MKGRVVIKFGGADLSSGERILKAAEMVVNSSYKEKLIVVSAMGKTTDNLIKTLSKIGDIKTDDYTEVISMGERTSARVFCSALKSLCVNSIFFDPSATNWPLITDSNYLQAKPNMNKTRKLVRKYLEPKLNTTIPVVCGFLGRDLNGRITTLGRGGSDITALLLANCLKADEVILVKETTGILSADPKKVKNARLIKQLDISEMFALSFGGAKIINANALKYKLPEQKLRVASFFSNNIDIGGTEITGAFNPNSAEITRHENLIAISLVCEINSDNLKTLFSKLGARYIYGVSTGRNSITVFTSPEKYDEIINQLHDIECFKAISGIYDVGMIEVNHPKFISSPGWIAKITNALSKNNINIIEIVTSKATINVFIKKEKLKIAADLVSEILKTED